MVFHLEMLKPQLQLPVVSRDLLKEFGFVFDSESVCFYFIIIITGFSFGGTPAPAADAKNPAPAAGGMLSYVMLKECDSILIFVGLLLLLP